MTYFIQKAIDQHEVNHKKVDLWNLHDKVMQPKYDGCHLVLTYDRATDKVHARSSSGDEVLSIPGLMWVEFRRAVASIKYAVGPEFNFITICGEAWIPGKPHHEISGAFRRHTPQDALQMRAFDMLFHKDIEVLEDDRSYRNRWATLVLSQQGGAPWSHLRPVAHCFPGWKSNVLDYANTLKATPGEAYDGAILRDWSAPYTPGRCRAGEVVKVKPLLEFDLRVLCFNPAFGEKTGKKTGSIDVDFGGKVLGVAVLNESQLELLHADPTAWNGKIVAIEAMARSAKGLLREPRLKDVREDKTEPDLT
jgi:ATP-dependent DNA ligase